jgi:hypothetical protein
MLGYMASDCAPGEMKFYKDHETIGTQQMKHTSNDVAVKILLGERNEGAWPMVCWRVHAVPSTLKNEAAGLGNVHYICVTTFVATDLFSGKEPNEVRMAGLRLPGSWPAAVCLLLCDVWPAQNLIVTAYSVV